MKAIFSIGLSIIIFVSFLPSISYSQNMPPVQNDKATALAPPPAMTVQTLDSSGRELASTNFIAVGLMSNAVPPDIYEVWALKAIEDTKLELQAPNLDTNYQHSLKWLLRQLQGQLADHRTQVQQNNAFLQSVQANPRTAWTNMMDPITEALTMDVAHYERELASP